MNIYEVIIILVLLIIVFFAVYYLYKTKGNSCRSCGKKQNCSRKLCDVEELKKFYYSNDEEEQIDNINIKKVSY